MEVKKLLMFSGCGLNQYEHAVAKGVTDVEMLESLVIYEDFG
jgi:hypothetical protein